MLRYLEPESNIPLTVADARRLANRRTASVPEL